MGPELPGNKNETKDKVNSIFIFEKYYFDNSTALDHSRCERVVICANLVVLVGLKVRQRGVAGRGERHDFDPLVNQTLVEQFFEYPPE